jgi:hypothetical protein
MRYQAALRPDVLHRLYRESDWLTYPAKRLGKDRRRGERLNGKCTHAWPINGSAIDATIVKVMAAIVQRQNA